MAYTFHAMNYGPKPWQRVLVGEPNSGATVGAAGLKPAFVYVPGGGWGLRDPLPITKDYAGTEPFMQALLDSGSPYHNAYRVFVPFVASNSCNGPQTGVHLDVGGFWTEPAAGTTTSYTKGEFYSNNNAMFRANLDHTSALSNPAASTDVTLEPFSTFTTTVDSGATTNANTFRTTLVISAGEERFVNSNALLTMANGEQALVSTGSREGGKLRINVASPGLETIPTAGDEITIRCATWTEQAGTDCDNPKLRNRGEGSAAYGGQSVADVNRLIGWMRANKSALNIQPQKIALMGSSAGGQAAGMAAWSDQGTFGGKRHHTSANDMVAQVTTKPNALVLSITQAKAERFADTSGAGYTQQSQYLSFMASLYGDSRLGQAANWQAYPDDIKKSLDPYDAASRTGHMMPTCLVYTLDNGYDDTRTEDEVYNGNTSVAPEVHHSLHGRYYFEKLRAGAGSGGWGNVSSRLILKGSSNTEIRSYYEFSGINDEGDEGTHYEKTTVSGGLTRGDIIGNYIFEFLDAVL